MPIDPNTIIPDNPDPSTIVPDQAAPAPDRGPLGEIGTGLARGALVDLPTMVGKGLQYVGANNVGTAVRNFGEGMGQSPNLQLNPNAHNGVVNALAQGGEILTGAAPAMLAGGAAAMLGAPELAVAGAGALTMGAMGGFSAGQDTLEKAKAKGLDDATARQAAALNAGVNFAGQTAMGMVGGRLLGGMGSAIGKVLGTEGTTTAEGILGQMAGQGSTLDSIIKPGLKAAAGAAVENVGLGMTQAGVSAGIEKAYGVDDTSPWDAMKDQVAPMLGLTAMMTPLGLAGKALQVRSARDHAQMLAGTEATPQIRSQLADQYAAAIAKADPEKAAAFRQNAETAINGKLPLPIDPNLFQQGAVQPFDAQLQGPRAPDGSYGPTQTQPAPFGPRAPDNFYGPVNDPYSGIQGPRAPEDIYGPTQTQPDQFGPRAPENFYGPEQFEQQGPRAPDGSYGPEPRPAPQGPRAPEDFYGPAPETPPDSFAGPRAPEDFYGPEQRPEQQGPRAPESHYGPEQGPRQPNDPKAADEITTDITAANKTLTGDDTIKKQALVPVQKQLDKLGLDQMATHQEQITALDNLLADKSQKIGQTTRDRLEALSDQWKEAMPKAEEAKAAEEPAAPAAPAEPAQAAPAEEAKPVEGAKPAEEAKPVEESAAPQVKAAQGAREPRDDEGVIQPYPATAHARELGGVVDQNSRKNPAAAKAAQAGNFGGVLDALSKSKTPIIARVAEMAKKLTKTHKIEVNDEIGGESQDVRRARDDGEWHAIAQQFVGKLRALRAAHDAHEAIGEAKPGGGVNEMWANSRAHRDVGENTRVDVSDLDHPDVRHALARATDENGTASARDVYRAFGSIHDGEYTTDLGNADKTRDALGQHEQRINNVFHGEENLGNYARGYHIDTRMAVGGHYDPAAKTVRVKSIRANSEHVLGHEIMHALTHEAIDRPTEAQRPIVQRMRSLYEFVRDKLQADDDLRRKIGDERVAAGGHRVHYPNDHYGITSLHEFVSEGYSNSSFQRYLRQLKYQNSSAWKKFTKHVGDLMGIKEEDGGNALTELLNLHEELQEATGAKKAAKEAPAAKAKPVAPPVEAKAAPAPAAAAPRAMDVPPTAGKKPIEQAFDMRDALSQMSKAYEADKQAGTLSPEQAAHAQHVNSLLDSFKEMTGRRLTDYSRDDMPKALNDRFNDLMGYGQDALRGGDSSELASRSNLPGQTNPHLLDSIGGQHVEGKLHDALGDLAENGSKGWVRTYAKFLQSLNLPTKIMGHGDMDHPRDGAIQGQYTPTRDAIDLFRSGMNEQTLLHEATHAAQAHIINYAQSLMQKAAHENWRPTNQFDALMLRMGRELDALRQEVQLHASASRYDREYGLTDNHEFLAELNSNPSFQQFLKDTVPAAEGNAAPKSLWQRAVEFVKKLFGATGKPNVPEASFFDRAMSLNHEFFDAGHAIRQFMSSPEGALKSTDQVLHSMANVADHLDRITDKVPMESMSRGLFQKTLGWKTTDFIAHQVRGVPSMVESGFSKAVDAYRSARDTRRIVGEHLSQSLGEYVERAKAAVRATKDAKAFNLKLMRVAGEASIHGFDFTKNYADNLKDRPGLEANADYVNQIHREFTQLPKTLQDTLTEGAKLNRKSYVQTQASIAKNLMSIHTGVVPNLEAKIARLQPGDAARARLENELALARAQSDFAAKHMPLMDFMDKSLENAKNSDPSIHADGAASELDKRVRDMFRDAMGSKAEGEKKRTGGLPEGSELRNGIAELEKLYNKQTKAPYFSLGRDGDHFVNLKFKEGANITPEVQARLEKALAGTNKVLGNLKDQKSAFFRVDTLDQAKGLFDKLVNAGGADVVDVENSSKGMLTLNDMQGAAGITPALRMLERSLHDNADLDTSLTPDQALAVKQNITRQLLSMLPETSGRSAKMERRGVPGYEGDFVGNYARRASGVVQDLSNAYTNRQFGQALKDMKTANETMNRGADTEAAARATMVAGEINKRYQNSMTRMDNSAVNLLNSFGHSFYLAVSPAFFIRTMAQPYHRGVPITGARYGFVRASTEMAKATATAMHIIQKSIAQGWKQDGIRGAFSGGMRFDDLPNLTADEKKFIQEMHDRGVLKLGEAQQLQHAVNGSTQRQQDLARFASASAQYAEMTNRLTVGLSAYRLARDGGKGFRPMDFNGAANWAHEVVNNAMDNFDPDNTARQIGKFGFAGKSTPLFTSFMNYNLQTMQQIVRTVQDGFFGKDKSAEGLQRSKEAKREFAGLMAATAMISGALGLPFVNAFAGVYNTLVKSNDDPSDIRGDFRNFLTNTFGQGAGDFIAHGAGSLINMDTSTFGLENLLPGSEFLASRQQFKDRVADQSQQLLGPAINGMIDVGLGAHDIMVNGNWQKGIEQMLPSGLKPYYKAAELSGAIGPGGYTDAKGNQLPAPFNHAGAWDIGLQAAGFRTAEKATRDEAAREFAENQQGLTARREVIGDHVFKASRSTDPDAMNKAMSEVAAYNAANPMQPMTDIGGIIQRHAMSNALGAGLGIPMTIKQMPVAQKQLGYAAMPTGQ